MRAKSLFWTSATGEVVVSVMERMEIRLCVFTTTHRICFLMTPASPSQATPDWNLMSRLDLSELQCDKNDQWPQVVVSWSWCACRDHVTLSLVHVSFDARSDQGVVKYLNPFIKPTSNISTDFSLAKKKTHTHTHTKKKPHETAATRHIMLEGRATFTTFGWSLCDGSLRVSRRLLAAGTDTC